MKVRPGFLYALLLSLGLLLWVAVFQQINHPQLYQPGFIQENVSQEEGVRLWNSTEALDACALECKAHQIRMEHFSIDPGSMQGVMVIKGDKKPLKDFYGWLETDGRFQEILSFDMDTAQQQNSTLQVHFQLIA